MNMEIKRINRELQCEGAITKYYKDRKKHELAVAIGYSIFALISVVLYFLMLFHVI